MRFLYTNGSYKIGLTKFLYNLVIPQYIALSLLFNFGILGNPNYKTKSFLRDRVVSSIIKSNTIYLTNVESKTQTDEASEKHRSPVRETRAIPLW